MVYLNVITAGREGELDCTLCRYLKFYNHVIYFVRQKTLDTFMECRFVGSKLFLKNYTVVLFIIIGDVYKYIVIVLSLNIPELQGQ